ncbi:MAG: hypothetical protein CMJ46_14605 [Planctomyces sp.]|nr:hypothetical protein [Planctomyces sp.]
MRIADWLASLRRSRFLSSNARRSLRQRQNPRLVERLEDRTLLTISFNFIYPGAIGSGIGFEDASQGQARRDSLEAAAATYGGFFDETGTIDVAVSSYSNAGTSTLASAGSPYYLGGSGDFNHLIAATKILTGQDLNGVTADASLSVNWAKSFELADDFQSGEYDFTGVIMHELSHALGFVSLINQNGSSKKNSATLGNTGEWSTFDEFLADSTGMSLIDPDTYILDSSWTTHSVGGTSPDNGLFFNGYNAMMANGGELVGLYSPTTWSGGSSVSHLDTNNPQYQSMMMSHSRPPGLTARTFDTIELGIWKDLGFDMVGVSNSAPVGMNDGGTGFETDAEESIELPDLLANDFDPEPEETETLRISSIDTTNTLGYVDLIGTGVQTRFTSTGPFSVPAVGTQTYPITVSGIDGKIRDINVNVDITHDVIAELALTLISPTGKRVQLTTSQGGFGDNFTNTYFNDEALIDIDESSASGALPPFTGSFRPIGNLSDYDGDLANGIWQLEIYDAYTSSPGTATLHDWSIDVIAQSIDYYPNGAFESLAAGEQGIDTFTYTVMDENGNTSTATATITIQGLEDTVTLPFTRTFEELGTEGLVFSDPLTTSIVEYNGSQQLELNNVGLTGLSTALLDYPGGLPGTFEMATEVTSISGANRWNDGFLIFDYQNDNDFKYAGMFTGQNQWMIGHYQGNWSNRIAEVDLDDIGRKINSEQEYLLHLRVDGDTATLSADGEAVASGTFTGGVSTGSAGVGAYNAQTLFDSIRIASEVTLGQPNYVPYTEDFNDGFAEDFNFNYPGDVTVVTAGPEGQLEINSSVNGHAVIGRVPVSGLPEAFDISATITTEHTGTGWQDGFIVFDYVSDTDFKYAGFFTGQNEWIVGHYQGSFFAPIAEVDWDDVGRKIRSGESYDILVRVDGENVKLFANDELIISTNFASPVNHGPVGVAAKYSKTIFDDFEVSAAPATLDSFFENFDDQVADDLMTPDGTPWSFDDISGNGSDYVLSADSNPTDDLALQLTDSALALPDAYTLSADMRFNQSTGGWRDGFLIFDYKSPTDFKYAGTFAGQKEWVIGHYQGHWGNRLAQIDWDDEGKFINIDDFYDVELSVNGSVAVLSVNGEEIVSHAFDGLVTTGQAGIAAYNAYTEFDNVTFTDDTIGVI